MTKQEALRKLVRFAGIYGWSRALNKTIARTRPSWLRNPFIGRRPASVSVIGCGQFAFSCVCFYVQKHKGNVFLTAFDINANQSQSLGNFYRFCEVAASSADVFANPNLRLLYVVSNHASHTDYAIEGLRRGSMVYVEKPVSVSYRQLVQLAAAVRTSAGRLFAGYNRPYSAAIQTIRKYVVGQDTSGAFSLAYYINGHVLPADHWYRNPDEGTRVCGNLGHWIDLTIHIWQWRGLPSWVAIQIAYGNPDEPDDNLCVTFTTELNDIVSMLLTARSEPFEGISESINLQYGTVIARIDDFRTLTVWQGSQQHRQRYSRKDVGHERAVLQPYQSDNRSWQEVIVSTLLMLHVKDMVLNRQTTSRFSVPERLAQLDVDIQQELASPLLPHQI